MHSELSWRNRKHVVACFADYMSTAVELRWMPDFATIKATDTMFAIRLCRSRWSSAASLDYPKALIDCFARRNRTKGEQVQSDVQAD